MSLQDIVHFSTGSLSAISFNAVYFQSSNFEMLQENSVALSNNTESFKNKWLVKKIKNCKHLTWLINLKWNQMFKVLDIWNVF